AASTRLGSGSPLDLPASSANLSACALASCRAFSNRHAASSCGRASSKERTFAGSSAGFQKRKMPFSPGNSTCPLNQGRGVYSRDDSEFLSEKKRLAKSWACWTLGTTGADKKRR